MLKKGKRRAVIITAALVVISIIALIFSIVLTENLRDNIALNQVKLVTERTESETASFYGQLNQSLKLISGLLETGAFNEIETGKWSSVFAVILQSNSNVSSISIVQSNGIEYFVSLANSNLIYYTLNNELKKVALHTLNLQNNEVTTVDTIIPNRAINMESYRAQLLVQPDSIVWYPIQPLPGIHKTLGLTASIKVREKSSGNDAIITINVSVRNIYKYLKTIAENVNAEIFLFTRDHKFLNLETKVDSLGKLELSDYLVTLDSIKSPVYKKAISKWENISNKDSIHFQLFKLDKKNYWGVFRSAQRKTNNLWIALIVAEDDFLTVLKDKLGILFFIPILVLLSSVIVLTVIIRRNSLLKKSKTLGINDIQKLIEKGESEHIEFKSTIRTNLFTNKPGKEIELAWLKSVVGFCNSEGGTILIGVNDEGEIVGLEADNFANDDKCLLHVQNLIRDHVGMEFTKYINYRLVSDGEKKILVVNCMVAPEPLFLLSNNKEQFYVRSGPASIELPMSKALKYIGDRKNN